MMMNQICETYFKTIKIKKDDIEKDLYCKKTEKFTNF